MIKVSLEYCTEGHPLASASHAAKMCYQAEPPQYGELINVKDNLFKTSHHTTISHFFLTYKVEGIAIGDITFGLHLAAPFYNSDQRSGRFCGKMFANPDIDGIMRYIDTFWPGHATGVIGSDIRRYLGESMADYARCLAMTEQTARAIIRHERPKATQKYIDQNAPKFAQEQSRMFVPVIFPTGFDYTINLVVLASLYRAAWSPVMRFVTQRMADAVVARFPEIAFMFEGASRRLDDWVLPMRSEKFAGVCFAPTVDVLDVRHGAFLPAKKEEMHPVDLLHYIPERMENCVDGIEAAIEISVATMGQDQRHRTIRRGVPKFTGAFYAPPLISYSTGLSVASSMAKCAMDRWFSLFGKIPQSLATVLAPYGAMVAYRKAGSFNAVAHEQAKRLCWCAQEEIYHLSRSLRQGVLEVTAGDKASIEQLFDPPCRNTGICGEGGRYCGRDLYANEYFPSRMV